MSLSSVQRFLQAGLFLPELSFFCLEIFDYPGVIKDKLRQVV
jgi:hypothetical protein